MGLQDGDSNPRVHLFPTEPFDMLETRFRQQVGRREVSKEMVVNVTVASEGTLSYSTSLLRKRFGNSTFNDLVVNYNKDVP